MMAYYHDVADRPGDIVLPCEKVFDAEYEALAREVGATWLLTAEPMDLDEVRDGPPAPP